MADDSRKQRADAQFQKMQRAEDGKKAMSEYEAASAAVRVRTARLRELRLARDAAEQAAPSAAPAKKKAAPARTKKSAKKGKSAPAPLSDWLKEREESGHNS